MKFWYGTLFLIMNVLWTSASKGQTFSFDEEPVVGNSASRVSLPEKQGTLLGLAGKTSIVGNMGGLSYAYSIKLASWRGLFDELRLSYASTGSYGIWGQGFSDNIPYIERSTQFGVPTGNSPFRSSESGELVDLGSGYYRARIEGGYTRFDFKENMWIASNGKGQKYYYGRDESSREGTEFVTRWWLSRIEDPAGHSVNFLYKKDTDDQSSSLQRFVFTEKNQAVSYLFSLQYEANGTPWKSYISGNIRTLKSRVSSVKGFWLEQKITLEEAPEVDLQGYASGQMFEVKLSYLEAGPSKRSLLNKVIRYGLTGSDAMPETELSYSLPCLDPLSTCNAVPNFQQDIVLSGKPSLNATNMRLIDINSDGLLDILGHSQGPGTTGVWFNQGTDSSELWLQFAAKTPLPLQNLSFDLKDRLLMDINGDRKIDMIMTGKAFLNQGGNTPVWISPGIALENLGTTPPINDASKGAWIDINADSKTDYVEYLSGPDGATMSLKIHPNESQGNQIRFASPKIIALTPTQTLPNRRLDWADINGDGLVDLLLFIPNPEGATNQVSYWINQGNQKFSSKQVASVTNYREARGPRWFDINGDGYVDAIFAAQGTGIKIYLNNGLGSFDPITTAFLPSNFDTAGVFEFGDMNGNGSRDLIVGYGGNRLAIYDPYFQQPVAAPYMLQEVKTSLGQIDKYTYRSSSNGIAELSLGERLPTVLQVPRRWLQTAMRFNEGGAYARVVSADRDYQYSKGFYDTSRNELLGFAEVKEWVYHNLDKATGEVNRSLGQVTESIYYTFENSGLLRGKIKSQKTSALSSGMVQQSLSNDYAIYPLFGDKGVYLPVLRSAQKRIYEGKDFAETSSKFCTSLWTTQGVPARIVKTEAVDGKDYRITETRYMEPGDHWLVKFPKEMRLLEPNENKIYLAKAYEYHPDLCKIQQVSRLIAADTWQVLQRIEYDELGNTQSSQDADGALVRLSYTGPGGFAPSEVETSAGDGAPNLKKQARYNYRVGGLLERYLDENGKESHLDYDGLGRLLNWYTPLSGDRPAYAFRYEWGSGTTPSRVISTQFDRTANETQYLDSLLSVGPLIVPSESGFILKKYGVVGPGGQTVMSVQPQAMDSEDYGQISIDPRFVTTMVYDEKLREISREDPAFQGRRSTSKTLYGWEAGAFFSTTINAEQEYRKVVSDPLGRTIKKMESASDSIDNPETTILAEYDIVNRLITIQPVNSRARHQRYNQAGQLFQISSEDIGQIDLEYTPGDLLKARLARGSSGEQSESAYFRYDGLKRETEGRYLRGQALPFDQGWGVSKISYRKYYDVSTDDNPEQVNLLGRLTQMNLFPGVYYQYSYDDDGNRNKEEVQLYDKRHKTEYSFGPTGQMLLLRYPDGEELIHEYSPRTGLLAKIGNLVDSVGRDKLGRTSRLNVNLGPDLSNISMNFAYDDASGLMTDFAVEGTAPIMKSKYENYDLLGRPTKVSGSDLITSNLQEDFQYDKRGQLLQANYQLTEVGKEALAKNFQFAYAPNGDILRQEGIDFEYIRNEKGALTEINSGPAKWQFDDLGRIKNSPGIRRSAWYGKSSPACFANETASYRYSYFPDGGRFSEVRTDKSGTRSTAFLNQFVEYTKETDSFQKYYFVEGLRVAVSENKEKSLLVEDLLHSGRMRLSKSGEVSFYAVYGPYGKKVLAKTAENKAENRYQFAGGLADTGVGVQQFGGRFYDPSLARFVSADATFIENPSLCLKDPISCGLYAYARNNPQYMTDPSGEMPAPAIIILGSAIGGGVVSGASTLISEYLDHGTINRASMVRVGVSTMSGFVKGGVNGLLMMASASNAVTIGINAFANTIDATTNERLVAKEEHRPLSIGKIALSASLSTLGDALGGHYFKGTFNATRGVVKDFAGDMDLANKVIGVGSRLVPGIARDTAAGAGAEALKSAIQRGLEHILGMNSTASNSGSESQAKGAATSEAQGSSKSSSTPIEAGDEPVFGARTPEGAEIPSNDDCNVCFSDTK